MNNSRFKGFSMITRLLAFCLMIIPMIATAADDKNVVSETMIQLQEDGRSYIQHRAIRSKWTSYDFLVGKDVTQDELFYVYPKDYTWDDKSSPDSNILRFAQGSFVVMYPGQFKSEVTRGDDGVYTFKSWGDQKAEGERFGFWNAPGNYAGFVYAWMFPEKFEVIEYSSNSKGDWVKRNNTIAFYGKDLNNITFTIKYREKPQPPAPAPALPDSDGDGVVDLVDECPDTPKGQAVTKLGCEKDSDGDGVVDSKDKCPNTPKCTAVDENGCEADADKDGIPDSKDKCPNTPTGAKVNQDGCELDSDKDGIPDSKDKCPDTPAGAKVNDEGCEADADKDGVPDSKDKCPDTPAGAKVNEDGCELDSDKDGVVDSKDKCPNTPAGAKVNDSGCPADADGDGVADSSDLCPNTKPGVEVDGTGCEKTAAITLEGVNFKTASAELTADSSATLNRVVEALRNNKELQIEVAGHTDNQGSAEKNQQLSQKRAEAVRQFLIDAGIDGGRLVAKGYGADKPVADNGTDEGRAKNRRVELTRLP